MNNKPSIFIVGTMKGGTTILYDYLCEHPKIKGGSQKEIHYFSLHYEKGTGWYNQHFSHLSEDFISIDASPTYFDAAHTNLIPKLIRNYNPASKAILLVRNPIERAISHFFHLKHVNKIPDIQKLQIDDFFARDVNLALAESDELDFCLMQVLWFSCYYRKALYYKSVFNSDLLIIQNSSLRNDSQTTMDKIFEFIGVESIKSPLFGKAKYNRNTSINEINMCSYNKLENLFRDDYERLCKKFNLSFHWVEPT